MYRLEKIFLLLAVSAITISSACDFHKLRSQLMKGELSLVQYTVKYAECISGGKKSQTTTPIPEPGFQPSCDFDVPVVQAVAKFNSKGKFKAGDGKMHSFHVKGVVSLSQKNETTMIKATVSGLHSFVSYSKIFSLHVHQKGEVTPDCMATGGHYNPCGMNHSNDATVEDRHVGDVAQVTIPTHFLGFDDVLTFTRVDSQVKLSGPLSVLGRSITVHAGSRATRIGCGTIAVAEWEGEHHPHSFYSSKISFWR